MKEIHRGPSLTDIAAFDTNQKINRHIMAEIDKGIGRWIKLTPDQKANALLKTIKIKDEQIGHLKVTERLLHEFVEEAIKVLTLVKRGECWCDHAANKFAQCKCEPVKEFWASLQSIPQDKNQVEVSEESP